MGRFAALSSLPVAPCLLALCLLCLPATAAAQWPNNPDENPLDALPNDPGYAERDGSGNIVGGQWNLWSFTPDAYTRVVASERDLGTGMHADRAWQLTPGDPRVLIAVLDSGIRWNERDLHTKYALNRGELEGAGAEARPLGPPAAGGDDWDLNADGILTVADYLVNDEAGETARLDRNANGFLEGQDFILAFSNQTDDDGNGFVDDIAGWDMMWNDNDPFDDTNFGHGTGEAKDSAAMGNNGIGGIGVCPECSILMVRVGDSFVTDSNDFADAVVFAVDSGASVIQEALGTVNMTRFAYDAIEYAYRNNVVVIASAADELSFHHNMPGTTNHTVYVHAVTHDEPKKTDSSTFLNYNNCTNHGGQLVLSSPGEGCSSEATGVSAGHAGMIYAAAIGPHRHNVASGLPPLDPPLSAEEVRLLMLVSADDIAVAGSATDPEKYPSGPGWDFHFGYGRNNVRSSLDLVVARDLPPEADLIDPLWFETLFVDHEPQVEIHGRVGTRVDGRNPRYDSVDYVLEYALGADPKGGWTTIVQETAVAPKEGVLATWDLATVTAVLDVDAPAATDPHEDAVTLRLRVSAVAPLSGNTVTGEMRKTVFVHRDPDLLAGFPIHIGASMESSSKFADLDGNGAEELVFVSGDGYLHALTPNGELPGFPAALPHRAGHAAGQPGSHEASCAYLAQDDKRAGCPAGGVDFDVRHAVVATPAIGDLEGDGSSMELVVATMDGSLQAFRSDGSVVPGFPVGVDPSLTPLTDKNHTLDLGFLASPALFDLDGDGDLEIVAPGMDQWLYVFHHDGTPLDGFPVLLRDTSDLGYNFGARAVASPAIGDIDLDGLPEIICATNELYDEIVSRYYIIDPRGNNAPGGAFEGGAPIPLTAIFELLPLVGKGTPCGAVIANVDTDPYPEYSIAATTGAPTMRSWDGEAVSDERYVAYGSGLEFGALSNSTDVGAIQLMSCGIFTILDDTGDLAYARGTAGFNFLFGLASPAGSGKRIPLEHQLMAWSTSGDGLPVLGFPQVVDDWQFISSPSAADIDGDNRVEVLVGTGGYRIFALNYRGEQPAGWPKFTGGWALATPSIGDFDGDGKLEVAVGTRNGWLFAWRTNGSTSGPIDWRNFGHDLRNTQNYDQPFVGQGKPTTPVEPVDTADAEDVGQDAADPGVEVEDTVTGPDDAINPLPESKDDGCCATVRLQPEARSPWLAVLALAASLLVVRRRKR